MTEMEIIKSQLLTITSTGDIIYHEDGVTPVQGVNSSEVTHRLLLKEVGNFEFTKPYKSGANKFSWGLTMHDAEITPVPVGVDPESYLSASPDYLENISFGFTFEPEVSGNVLKAPIKLDQFFAPFNGDGISNNGIGELDLAILYVSTILHFSLKIDVLGEDTEDPSTWLNEEDDYYEETHSLRVGNYLGKSFSGKLEFVDITLQQIVQFFPLHYMNQRLMLIKLLHHQEVIVIKPSLLILD